MKKTLTAFLAATTFLSLPYVAYGQVKDLKMGAMEQIKAEQAEEPQPMSREVINLRSINPSFNESDMSENVKHYNFAPEKTYKIRLSQFMRSTIVLPKNENIIWYSVGDEVVFDVQKIGEKSNVLSIGASYAGADTNLVVSTDNGRVYSFYLRNDPHDSKYAPDLVVYLDNYDNTTSEEVFVKDVQKATAAVPNDQQKMLDIVAKTYGENEEDYLNSLPKPDKINVAYTIKGNGDEIAPYSVWDDGNWTWFKFNHPQHERGSARLPVIYQVVDGYDAHADVRTINTNDGVVLVATRLSQEGWTLRNGDKHICIRSKNGRQVVEAIND